MIREHNIKPACVLKEDHLHNPSPITKHYIHLLQLKRLCNTNQLSTNEHLNLQGVN